jgi:hypothetical protein
MMARTPLTAHQLRELLAYDPITGVFTRLARTANSVKVGSVAGSDDGSGYLRICVSGSVQKAHRLAWLYVYGLWPTGDIDHIDGNPSNNRIANLRDVTTSVNMQNQRRARSDNASGFLGVSRVKDRWRADINTNGKSFYIGLFDSPAVAHAAYIDAKRELHEGNTI